MSSHKKLVSDIERQSVRLRINLYKQMKEQFLPRRVRVDDDYYTTWG